MPVLKVFHPGTKVRRRTGSAVGLGVVALNQSLRPYYADAVGSGALLRCLSLGNGCASCLLVKIISTYNAHCRPCGVLGADKGNKKEGWFVWLVAPSAL